MAKAIYFDMDGTLVDLYSVDNWMEKLRNYDVSPYIEAKALMNMQALAHRLNKLQAHGCTIGIISWSSKVSTPEFDKAVAEAKMAWLKKHLASVHFDEVIISPYGKKKHKLVAGSGGYIFEDNATIRKEWIRNRPEGWAFSQNAILEVLDILK